MAVDREFNVYSLALLFADRKMIEVEPLSGLPKISWQSWDSRQKSDSLETLEVSLHLGCRLETGPLSNTRITNRDVDFPYGFCYLINNS